MPNVRVAVRTGEPGVLIGRGQQVDADLCARGCQLGRSSSGRCVARARGEAASCSTASTSPLRRITTVVAGLYPTAPVGTRGRTRRHWTRCMPAARLPSSSRATPSCSKGAHRRSPSPARRRRGRSASRRALTSPARLVPLHAASTASAASRFDDLARAHAVPVREGLAGHAPARPATSTRSGTTPPQVRIVVDVVAAVASAHRRRQLHPRLAAPGSSRRRRRADEVVAFAPASVRGTREIESRARRMSTCARGLPVVPVGAHALRTLWSRARLAAARARRRSARRLPLQRLDVSAAARRASARRWFTTSCRCTIPSGCTRARARCTARSTGTRRRRCDVVIVNSRFTGDDVAETLGVDPARHPRRVSGRRAAVHPGGRAARPRRPPYALTVATLEPRKNLSTLVEAYRQLDARRAVAARRRRRGLGRPAGARRARDRPARLHAARGPAARSTAARASFVYPVALRRLRHAGRRGDGVRRAVRRLVASVARRGVRRRRRACRPGETRRRSRKAIERALDDHDELARARARARARGSPGSRTVARISAAWRAAVVNVARRRHRRSRRRARVPRATSTRCSAAGARGDAVAGSSGFAFGGAGTRPCSRATSRGTRSALARARGADVLHCPTYRGPVARGVPVVVTVHDLAVLRHPEAFPRGRATTAARRPARAARRARGSSRSPSSPQRELVALLGVPAEKVRVVAERRRRASSRPTARAPTATTCSRSATLEPRKNLARVLEATARGSASSCASSASAAGAASTSRGDGVTLARRGRRRGARALSTAARAASPTRRSTRASASRCSRRWRAARRS